MESTTKIFQNYLKSLKIKLESLDNNPENEVEIKKILEEIRKLKIMESKNLKEELYQVKIKISLLNSKIDNPLYKDTIESLMQEQTNIRRRLNHKKYQKQSEERKIKK